MNPIKDEWVSDDGRIRLLLGDSHEVLPAMEAGSVDAVITDPPYPRKFEHVWQALGEPAFRVCKENAFLATLLGHYQLPLVLDTIRAGGWEFYWVGMLSGNKSAIMHGFKVKCCSKPSLVFRKGSARPFRIWRDDWGKYVGDAPWRKAKTAHGWGQPAESMYEPISAFTEEDGLVLDPFLGGGSTAAACIWMHRRFIGVELERESFDVAVSRCKDVGRLEKASFGFRPSMDRPSIKGFFHNKEEAK